MKKHILVVEDDLYVREVMVEALEMEGYRVTHAENGRDALNKIQTDDKPHLILLDMMMPIMTGRQFLDIVSKDQEFSTIPVVVVSASADRENTTGARTFIRKPTDLPTLLITVESYLR